MAAYGHRFNYLVLYEIAVTPHPSIRHFGLNVRNDKHTLSQWYLVGKKYRWRIRLQVRTLILNRLLVT